MKRIFFIIIVSFTILALINISSAFADWSGPKTVFIGKWGHGVGQFRDDNGDSEDAPNIVSVTPDGKIVISDAVSKKQVVIDVNGKFIKEVKWQVISREGGTTHYDIPEYYFWGEIIAYSRDGNIYMKGDKYKLVSPTGKILQKYESSPKEISDKKYNDHISAYSLKRLNKCGEVIAELKDRDVDIGSYFVVPNGDVYASNSTEDNFIILKWTWTEDKNAFNKPCTGKNKN